MFFFLVQKFIGIGLVITSIFDGLKYKWSADKIILVGTAKGHSRKFLNAAIINDIVKLLYGIFILDVFIVASSIFALITMGYNFWIVYKYYPYRKRGLLNFQRPSLWIYIWNSFMPNNRRKRL
jgi:hypothetical protein